MFKVGDRVWSYIYNKYMWVNEVTSSGCFLADDEKLLINYYHSNCEFHQTAQTMFEALGYDECEKTLNTLVYISNRFTITFDTINKEYWHDNDKSISVEEHLAIHQQMIELGYIE